MIVETGLFLTFVIVSAVLILTPGPNVLIIVSTSMAHGRLPALQTVAGTTSAMAIQLLIAIIGTSWLVHVITEGIFVVKWLGACYLFYLGFKHLLAAGKVEDFVIKLSPSQSFMRGFWVSLTNPKTILFFSAYLPQFVSSNGSYYLQLLVLSTSFLLLAALFDSAYALLGAKLSFIMKRKAMVKLQHVASGILFISASLWLALTRRA